MLVFHVRANVCYGSRPCENVFPSQKLHATGDDPRRHDGLSIFLLYRVWSQSRRYLGPALSDLNGHTARTTVHAPQARIAARSGLIPTMFIRRVRLYESACSAISVATFGSVFIRKCVAPIRIFSAPNGCSTVSRRVRIASGVLSRRASLSAASSWISSEIVDKAADPTWHEQDCVS